MVWEDVTIWLFNRAAYVVMKPIYSSIRRYEQREFATFLPLNCLTLVMEYARNLVRSMHVSVQNLLFRFNYLKTKKI